MPEDSYPVRWARRQAVVTLPEHIDVSNASQVREELLSVINRGTLSLIADLTATLSCDHASKRSSWDCRAKPPKLVARMLVLQHVYRAEAVPALQQRWLASGGSQCYQACQELLEAAQDSRCVAGGQRDLITGERDKVAPVGHGQDDAEAPVGAGDVSDIKIAGAERADQAVDAVESLHSRGRVVDGG